MNNITTQETEAKLANLRLVAAQLTQVIFGGLPEGAVPEVSDVLNAYNRFLS